LGADTNPIEHQPNQGDIAMLIATCLTAVMATAPAAVLVSTQDLESLEKTQIVDVRSEADYLEGRIPGALRVDVSALSAPAEGGVVNMLRPANEVAADLYQAGLDPEKATVVYGAFAEPADMLDTARLFWILEVLGWENVSVLDGGFPRWQAEERTIESGEPPAVTLPANPPAGRLVRQRIATKEDVQRIQKEGGAALVDARGVEYHDGSKQSGSVARVGRIPGSVNLPGESFVDFEGLSFLTTDGIRGKIESGGITTDTPTITYCNTGRSASVGYLAARIAGIKNVAMYDGSMAEWSADASCPIESGGE
jgi:thiosulfate/3-mercaptopyruvate sulfurtransferase